ncbi:G-patch domain-containing protein [Lojkania enalia]|uniref:G-patch domain-containing protein n=1 Tax=Lojkania enalia TaxID=147567 RepID=A0A9P4KFP5_9PLEO|nr:G-patch domain-containing protein [Didymosphaeria enalia]
MTYKRPRVSSPSTAQKRSRGLEWGGQNIKWGSPLPADEDNDKGSFLPVWKQTVTDEHGRRRLHGAFTGGFSAGYFNTVGSKEGWTPKAFVSSRSNRAKNQDGATQRPEDFMDEEDLAEAAQSRRLETTQSYAMVGSAEGNTKQQDGFFGLVMADENTMAVKLLQKMGWRRGQGIGPRVRRQARLDEDSGIPQSKNTTSEHLFAPEDTQIIYFTRDEKVARKGIGYLSAAHALPKLGEEEGESAAQPALPFLERSQRPNPTKEAPPKKTGFGVGILNDNGSDDEDPYEIGPKISFNKVLGKEKKSRKPSKFAKSAVGERHFFVSKKGNSSITAPITTSHDGRTPLKGFVFATQATIMPTGPQFPAPKIPEGWKSSKRQAPELGVQDFQSVADTAKMSTLDAKARATLLGETPLPAKSIFDYMSKESRDRIAAITGNQNLPPGKGEVLPEKYRRSEAAQQKDLWSFVPALDRDIAASALAKGVIGWMPYAEDPKKRGRYVGFLELHAGIRNALPERITSMSVYDWAKELEEFAHAAHIFKPVQGLMASRFTSSSSSTQASKNGGGVEDLVHTPTAKPGDPAEQAAKLGMYGAMTRRVIPFHPTRLLCKRFNVNPPTDVPYASEVVGESGSKTREAVSKTSMDKLFHEAMTRGPTLQRPSWMTPPVDVPSPIPITESAPMDVETNDNLSKDRPPDDVFRSIFGDDDDNE